MIVIMMILSRVILYVYMFTAKCKRINELHSPVINKIVIALYSYIVYTRFKTIILFSQYVNMYYILCIIILHYPLILSTWYINYLQSNSGNQNKPDRRCVRSLS